MSTKAEVVGFRTRHPDLFAKQQQEEPTDNTDDLIAAMDRYGIDVTVAMSRAGLTNDFIAEMCKRHPGRLVPLLRLGSDQQLNGYLADPTPAREAAPDEVRRCIEEFGMRGIGEIFVRSLTREMDPEKIADDLGPIMDVLAEYELPIAFPTGWSQWKGGLQYHNPLWIDELAGRYPTVPVVITKMGRGFTSHFESALMVAVRNDNVYFDITHTSPEHLRQAVSWIGADRIIFGTDWSVTWQYLQSPEDVHSLNLHIVDQAGLSPDERAGIYNRAATKLFKLDEIRE